MRIERISSKMTAVSLEFIENLRKHWLQVLLIWVTIGLSYLYFGGSFVNLPKHLLFITGLLFSLIVVMPGKFYNKIAISIVISGSLFVVTSPNLDIPDENAHFARALYVADFHPYLPKNEKDSQISEDIEDVTKQFKVPLKQSGLNKIKSSLKKVHSSLFVATNASSFLPYIPQAIGIWIARLLGLSVLWLVILGRFSNLICYALITRLAMKKAKGFELLFGTVALLPMCIYIASSFSTDGMVNALTFYLVAQFCHFINREKKVSLKEMILYSLLCIVMATMKLPYVLLVGLLLFIPSNKMEVKKNYLYAILLILIAAVFSFLWLKQSSEINASKVMQGVSPVEKVKFTLSHLNVFIRKFFNEWIDLVPNKITSVFTFGWLTYGLGNLAWYYLIFIGGVLLLSPQPFGLPKFSKFGAALVATGIGVGILMTSYLMRGQPTDIRFDGVQGRYFIGVLLLIGLFANCSSIFYPSTLPVPEKYVEKREFFVYYIAHLFVLMTVVLTILQYYGVKN